MSAIKYKLMFTSEANADLDEIFAYITNNLSAPVAAEDLIMKIENGCNRLREYPFSCPIPGDDTLAKKGYRMLVVENFIAFYLVDNEIVKIMRVVYGKRNYQKLM